jgi:hypothetical protein
MYSETEQSTTPFVRIVETPRPTGPDPYTVHFRSGETLFVLTRHLRTWRAFKGYVALAGLYLCCQQFEGKGGPDRWLKAVAEAIQAGRRWWVEVHADVKRCKIEPSQPDRRGARQLRDPRQPHTLN